MRFALTAKTLARSRAQGFEGLNELTTMNVKKVTQFRKDGVEELEKAISKVDLESQNESSDRWTKMPEKMSSKKPNRRNKEKWDERNQPLIK